LHIYVYIYIYIYTYNKTFKELHFYPQSAVQFSLIIRRETIYLTKQNKRASLCNTNDIRTL